MYNCNHNKNKSLAIQIEHIEASNVLRYFFLYFLLSFWVMHISITYIEYIIYTTPDLKNGLSLPNFGLNWALFHAFSSEHVKINFFYSIWWIKIYFNIKVITLWFMNSFSFIFIKIKPVLTMKTNIADSLWLFLVHEWWWNWNSNGRHLFFRLSYSKR